MSNAPVVRRPDREAGEGLLVSDRCQPSHSEFEKIEHGYPPDMQLLPTDTVLKQAEMLAQEMSL